MGELLPCCVIETVPGETYRLGGDMMVRFAPLLAPMMHHVNAYIHYFFVPNRTIWPGFTEFISPTDPTATPPAHPYITPGASLTDAQERFLDYFGIPPWTGGGGIDAQVNPLPLMAYQKIYNEYYRDQNQIDPLDTELTNGSNSIGILATMRRRAWEHDMFTSSLPWTQKGEPVDLPLGSVELDPLWHTSAAKPHFQDSTGATSTNPVLSAAGPPANINVSTFQQAYDPSGSLTVEATTINDLRRAEAIQKMLEIDARGGTRYNEAMLAHFGEDIGDATLQRADYIVGVKTPLVISEVVNTTGIEGELPQGNLAGHGVAAGGGDLCQYHVSEFGFIIGILSVTPRSAYMWGLPKWSYNNDRYDYYWPSLANIGEEAVKNREVMAYTNNQDGDFGYNPRYYQLKFIPSRVAGEFFRGSGLYWHLARNFTRAAAIPLNDEFIEVDPDECERIFAVQNGDDNLFMHVLNKVTKRSPMPVYGTPQL